MTEVKPRKRLKSLVDVRRYLAALVNDTRHEIVTLPMAGKLGFLLNILRATISESDLENRIKALEDAEEDRKK